MARENAMEQEPLLQKEATSDKRQSELAEETVNTDTKATVKNVRSTSPEFFALLFSISLFIGCFWTASMVQRVRLPLSKHSGGSKYTPFKKDNAMDHIRTIAAKKRFVNTAALNESLFYIMAEMEILREPAKQNGIELDLELFISNASSFSTSVGPLDLINSYDRMMSVIARIRPENVPFDSTEKALLVNAHVDSAIGAPGASDNVVGVGVVMEIVRTIIILARKDGFLSRPIIFLFNAGEETVLTAAHSFITQHRWAKTIAVHINTEAFGSGKNYQLFRLGPHSPWLGRAYAKAVSVPSGSVTGTDVLDANLIPAETDFRIFNEIGGIPGYDFVLLENGYIYHTIYDDVDHVDEVGVCHAGDTIFELTMELAGQNDAIGKHLQESMGSISISNSLSSVLERIAIGLRLLKDPASTNVFFSDVLSFGMLVVDEGAAVVFNVAVLIFAALVWSYKFDRMTSDEFKTSISFFFLMLAALLTAFGTSTFAAVIYAEVLNAKLRWYGNWITAIIMFGPAALFGISSAFMVLLPQHLSFVRFDQMLFAVSALYAFFIAELLYLGMMTAFIFSCLLLVCTICALQGSSVHPLLRHFQIMAVHALVASKFLSSSLSVFLPLLGRVPSKSVPHDAIAANMVVALILLHGGLFTFPIIIHYARGLRKLRLFSFWTSIAVGIWLVLIYPIVTGKTPAATYDASFPKRISAIHFHSPQLNPNSVLWLGATDPIDLDYERILGKLPSFDKDVGSLPSEPHWGILNSSAIEGFRPFAALSQHGKVFRSGTKPNMPLPSASVTSEERVSDGWNVTVHVSAPESHLASIRMHVGEGSQVKNWSFNAVLKARDGGTWIKHVGSTDFEFWIHVKEAIKGESEHQKIPMVICSSRLGFSRSPNDLEQLTFEDWESPSVAVSTGYEFVL